MICLRCQEKETTPSFSICTECGAGEIGSEKRTWTKEEWEKENYIHKARSAGHRCNCCREFHLKSIDIKVVLVNRISDPMWVNIEYECSTCREKNVYTKHVQEYS